MGAGHRAEAKTATPFTAKPAREGHGEADITRRAPSWAQISLRRAMNAVLPA